MNSGAPLGRLRRHPDAAGRLRHALLSHDFDGAALAKPHRMRALAELAGGTLDWQLMADPGDPLTTLIELFVFGQRVERARAHAALAPLAITDAVRAGLAYADADGISSPWEISARDGLLLLGDHPGRLSNQDVDFVVSESSAAATLAVLTHRAVVERTLDMGTGSGIHALLAARHSGQVLAVDINPRATAITAFNAQLNAIDNVATQESDWFEHLQPGRRFGLVLCNPPYIVSPDVVFRFAHSGVEPNALCRHVIEESIARLAQEGFAQLHLSWTRRLGDDSADVLRGLLGDVDCDVLVLPLETADAATYIVEECGWLVRGDPERFTETVDSWLKHFHRTGFEVIERGLVTLRRRSGGTPWMRRLQLARGPFKATGEQIGRIFAGNDCLEALTDERALLDRTFLLPDGHHVIETYRHEKDGYALGPATLQLVPDAGFDATVPSDASSVMSSLNHDESLGTTIARVAHETGTDETSLRQVVLISVRHLLSVGFISISRDRPTRQGSCAL